MHLKSIVHLLIIFQFVYLVKSVTDDGQWKKEDLPKSEDASMDDDEPVILNKNSDRAKKSLDLNSTVRLENLSVDDKKLEDLKDCKQSNDTMGRSSSSYSLDELTDAKDEKEGRIMNADDEGVLDKPRMNIQGFIPVVGLASAAAIGSAAAIHTASQKRQRLYASSSDNSFSDRYSNVQQPSMPNFMLNQNHFNPAHLMSQHNQYQQTRFSGPRGERRRFTSTLQNLASSISGSLSGGVNKLTKRKQVVDYSSFAQECICVPFYMCRSGFIEQTAKNQPGAGQTYQMAQYNQYRDQSFFERQLQDAQQELNRYYTPQQITELLAGLSQNERSQLFSMPQQAAAGELYQESQRDYATINSLNSNSNSKINSNINSNSNSNQDSDLELPINERSIDGKDTTHFLNSAPNSTEIQALSRMLGLANAFANKNDQNGQSCGMLRTCCPLLSSKDILIAQQSLNSQQEPHGYSINNFNTFRQQLPPRTQPPIHLPVQSYPSLPIPIMPHQISPQPSYPMLASTIHYGTNPSNQINFNNRQLNRKSLEKNPYSNYNAYSSTNNNYQSKSSYTTLIKQYEQPIYQGKCGIRPGHFNQARIQNLHYPASSTEFGEFPWQGALLKRLGPQDSLFVCGATLITDQFVLTAAHCIKKNTALDLKVRLGEWDVHREDEFYPYIEREVAQIIKHPNFYPGTLENDIALIRLESPVQLSTYPHIMPACLPSYGENFAGRKCWTAGWGKSAFGHLGEYQSVLKKVDLPIIGHSTCNSILKRTKLGPTYDLHAGFMCAGGERGKDSCEGDGGSALVCDVNGVWKAAGLVSWGIGCGKQGLPGVYVNTGYYENWIRDTINEFERASPVDEGETDVESSYNFSKSGRVLGTELSSSLGSSMSASSHNNNPNVNLNEMNNDENENLLLEPASIINERSNSAVVNGTESDELTIPYSTESPKNLFKNSTSV